MRFSTRISMAVLACVLTVLAVSSFGQTVVGRINGTITDSSGRVIPDAQITLTALSTGITRTTKSGTSGDYVIESVEPGKYSLEVQKEGFSTYRVSSLVLQVHESRTLDAQLTVGAVTQSVNVTAAAVAVNVTNATVSQDVHQDEVVGLPLNGRNFTVLTLLTPGASPVQAGQQGVFTITGGVSPAVNGMRAQMNNFTLDGSDNNMRFTNSYAQSPPPDALEEFSVESHQTSAEASFAAGSTINIVTRSGNDQFHGSLWEFVRNNIFSTNGFFNNFYGLKTPAYKQNQYGFFLGGPVFIPHLIDGRKSRTFFASYYEGLKFRRLATTSATVPDAAERGGNLSELLGPSLGNDCLGRPILTKQLYDITTAVANAACPQGYVSNPFPGNIIPSSQITNISKAYLQYLYPLPNNSTGLNLVLSQRLTQDNWQWGTRIDHTFSDKDSIFGRVSEYNDQRLSPGGLPLNPLQQINGGWNIPIHETHIFSPSFLGDFLFAYNRATIPYRNLVPGPAFATAVGSAMGEKTALGFMPAGQAFSGTTINGVSFLDYELANPDTTYQGNMDFKKIHGKHDLIFGFRYLYFRHFTQLQGQASLSYVNNTTGLPGYTSTGDGFASFLVGYPTSSTQNLFPTLGLWTNVYIGYIGDIWKVTPKFTVNMGLQYVYDSPPLADNNHISDFNFGTALTQPNATDFSFAYIWAATNPLTNAAPNAARPSLIAPDRNNFAPRLGLAYRLGSSTSLRAGFGVYYDYNTNINQNSIRVLEPDYPFSIGRTVGNQNLVTLGPNNPVISQSNPFLSSAGAVPPPNWSVDLNRRDPYVMEWNVGVEHMMPGAILLSVDYIGSGARKLANSTYENVAVLGPGSIASRSPLHNVGTFVYNQNMGTSNYDGLQVKLDKNLSHGITFLNSYTYSKSMDNNSDANAIAIEYTYNRRLSYGPSVFDIRHMNITSLVYQLPFGRGRAFGSGVSGALDQVIGGWEASSIITIRGGIPFTVYSGVDNSNTSTPGQYAQIVSPPFASGFKSRAAWFNPAAFQTPTFGTLGNSSRDAFTGPNFENVDFALMKNFRVTEKLKLQFRAESFNTFNWTNFANPNATLTQGSLFGQITSVSTPAGLLNPASRDIQLALKLLW